MHERHPTDQPAVARCRNGQGQRNHGDDLAKEKCGGEGDHSAPWGDVGQGVGQSDEDKPEGPELGGEDKLRQCA